MLHGYDRPDDRRDHLLAAYVGGRFALDFNQDGSIFTTGNQDGTLHFLDTAPARSLAPHRHNGRSRGSTTTRRDTLVTVGLDDTVHVLASRRRCQAAPRAALEKIPEGSRSVRSLQPNRSRRRGSYVPRAGVLRRSQHHAGARALARLVAGRHAVAFQYVNPATGQYDGLWLADARRQICARCRAVAQDRAPSWSPDGSRLVFESVRDGENGIFVVDVATGLT